ASGARCLRAERSESMIKRTLSVAVLVAALVAMPVRRAEAFAFVDYSALIQRLALFLQYMVQFRQLLHAGQDSLAAFKSAFEDVKKIKDCREQIAAEHKQADLAKRPVNQAKVGALEAEITAVQAKYHGEDLMLRNQQAIMFLVGEDQAQRFYLETLDRGWLEQ